MDIRNTLLFLACLTGSAVTNASTIVINEFLPNATGTDSGNEWVELFNYGGADIALGDWTLQRATSSYTNIMTFGELTIPAGGFLLIGGSNIIADVNVSSLGLGNAGSSGDAIRIIDHLDQVIDTVIYGPNNDDGFLDDTGMVTINWAAKPGAGQSLGRIFDGGDSDNNAMDFILFDVSTPGFSNQPEVSAVPVPGALVLFATGLLGLVGVARRERMLA